MYDYAQPPTMADVLPQVLMNAWAYAAQWMWFSLVVILGIKLFFAGLRWWVGLVDEQNNPRWRTDTTLRVVGYLVCEAVDAMHNEAEEGKIIRYVRQVSNKTYSADCVRWALDQLLIAGVLQSSESGKKTWWSWCQGCDGFYDSSLTGRLTVERGHLVPLPPVRQEDIQVVNRGH